MSRLKNIGILLLFVLSSSLIFASATAVLMAEHNSRTQFELLGNVCRQIAEQQPEAERAIQGILKEQKEILKGAAKEPSPLSGTEYLRSYGYHPKDFAYSIRRNSLVLAGTAFLLGAVLFCCALWHWHRKAALRIDALTTYLEEVNTGKADLHLQAEEDGFSKLQDEIYKTVTFACQTRDSAVEAKQRFAENLSNIAHQLKTPITAISLSAQMISSKAKNLPAVEDYTSQIKRQLSRLTHLEEALLLLSRLDSGTLPLNLEEVDVFTVLTLAADNLQEVSRQAQVSVEIPEMGEIKIKADLEWTMEAIMNVLKNCIEHTPRGGAVHCDCEQNPLYTQIRIRDEGEGILEEDIPHLFERFYRGQRAAEGGIGIGLSIAKTILESENGMIRAGNLPEGGACFEIRIYTSQI